MASRNTKKVLGAIKAKAEQKQAEKPPEQRLKEILFDLDRQLSAIKNSYESIIFSLLTELSKQNKTTPIEGVTE